MLIEVLKEHYKNDYSFVLLLFLGLHECDIYIWHKKKKPWKLLLKKLKYLESFHFLVNSMFIKLWIDAVHNQRC